MFINTCLYIFYKVTISLRKKNSGVCTHTLHDQISKLIHANNKYDLCVGYIGTTYEATSVKSWMY